jgi:hypothetical protein
MANLKFYKMAQAPVGTTEKPLEKGAVWFDSTNHVIKVYDGANWAAYSGVIDASVANEVLTIKKYDGSTVSVDFSVYATDEALGLLDERVGTLEGTVAGHGESISNLSGRMTTVEGKAAVAEGQLAGLSEATVMAEIAKQVKVADDRALEAEGKLAERIGTLETASEDHEDRIAVIEGKFEGDDSVAKQIENAVSAAEGRVDVKLATKADKETYEAYVSANNERVAAAEKAIADETDRAEAAEALLNEKIGVPAGVEGVSAYSKDYTVGMDVKAAKDAAAEAQRTIDEFLTGEGIAPETLNSLKEITDYIEKHGGEYTALVEDLGDLSDAIDVLNGNAETAGSVAKAVADAKAEINATIEANEKVTAEALTELDGRVDALEGMGLAGVIEGLEGRIAANEAAVATVDSRIATAKAGAEATAAADATSKANTAESNAKGYADGLIAAEVTRSNKYADDAVAAEALIARAAEKANADAIAALDTALKAGEGFAWVTFE